MPTTTLTQNDDIFAFDPSNDIPDFDDDTIFGGPSTTVVVDGSGVDVNVSAAGTGNDSIRGTQGDDVIYGGDGNDTISSSFATNFPTIPLVNDGGDTVYGGDGDDVITTEGPGALVSSIHDTVYGGAGHDSIVGAVTQSDATAITDTLYGGTGNDTIDGNTGTDIIYGGSGDDVVIAREGIDATDGGAGNDTLDLSNHFGAVNYDMVSGATTITLSGGGTEDETNINYESAIATDFADSLAGTNGDNTLAGGAGADTLEGREGNDTFDTGDGNDVVVGGEDTGGSDIDVLDYSAEGDGVIVTYTGDEAGTAAGTTTDTDTFSEIERIIFTDLTDAVDASSDTVGINVDTRGGDDFVAAGQGADSMDGGAGIDELSYLNSSAPLTVDVGAGTATGGDGTGDTFANFEEFNLTDGDDSLTGSGGNETVNAQGGNDNVSTGGGDDTVLAGGGNDTVQGGAGADSLDGGADTDTLSYADSAAPVTVDLATDSVSGGDGTGDTIDNFENVIGSGGDDSLAGTNGDNTITGGGGNDSIDGRDGSDSIDAGGGNDTVAGAPGDDTMDGGTGNDTYDASGAPGQVVIDLGNNTAFGGGVGNDVVTNFENVIGGSLGDNITGDGNDNTIDGGDGDDTVSGGDGNDSVGGGDGNDQVNGGGGNDTVDGGEGNDILDGGTGNDTITGGGGDDTVFHRSGDGEDSIVGGETGETNGDTIIVSLDPGELADIVYSGGNDEAGVINIIDNGGNTLETVDFSEIEQIQIVCFTRGTMILTANGEKAIEELSEGDMVLTRDNGAQAIRWIGSQTVRAKGKKAPVMIKAGALGNDRDLRVSQLHRMLVADWRAELMFDEPEVLVAAKHLANGDTIYVEDQPEEVIEYFHMLFDNHEIVTANGSPSESFHPGQQGMGWMAEETREEIFEIFPQLRVDIGDYGDAARVSLKAYEAKALTR